MRFFSLSVCLSTVFLLSACNTQVITGEAAERLRHPYPYGARWFKEGMMRESRLADWVACGGGVNLSNGFRDWITPEPWERFNAAREQHLEELRACIKAKGYKYKNPQRPDIPDECSPQICLHP
jgi:hypothetical protein